MRKPSSMTPRRILRASMAMACLPLLLTACGGGDGGGGSTTPTEPPDLSYPSPSPASSWWKPTKGSSWQIQYFGVVDQTVNADVFDVDLFDTSVETIAALKAKGSRVLCYLNAGAWENWRPDKDAFPTAIIGNDYAGWPGEKWLNIAAWDQLAPLMRARLDLCKSKGFDGVAPDNLDSYTQATGFTISAMQQRAYSRWLAAEAHARGLAIGMKNDPNHVGQLAASFDFAIVESCVQGNWCDKTKPLLDAGKPVFAIEYLETGQTTTTACPVAKNLGLSLILKRRTLNAERQVCPA
ncbi:endo alpha-1,4 polygalactosaminidase [Chitinimonas sp. BJYL2]|uniref:endo alpha-1,4 polygalactosaminidase n=1 Tax=Chitinimonas sp. BJYL2 TaxID=2976696 RepID=UPI0022B40C5C|nr:endo alpha-1,4 polygalactosaminidase [Chitinimonas sp. BJYL2]